MAGVHHPRRSMHPLDIEPHSRLVCRAEWCGLPPFREPITLASASTRDIFMALVRRLTGAR